MHNGAAWVRNGFNWVYAALTYGHVITALWYIIYHWKFIGYYVLLLFWLISQYCIADFYNSISSFDSPMHYTKIVNTLSAQVEQNDSGEYIQYSYVWIEEVSTTAIIYTFSMKVQISLSLPSLKVCLQDWMLSKHFHESQIPKKISCPLTVTTQ